MSGLLESLTSASNALTAQRMGLDVAGQNMANVNTPGYSRRVLELADVPPAHSLSAGRGVTVLGVRALRDQLVEGRLRRADGDTSRDTALAEIVAAAEAAIGLPGQSLDADLSALFDAFGALALDPTSAVARDTVVRQGQNLSTSFARLSAQFTIIQGDADLSLRAAVGDVNRLASQIASLNSDIATASYNVESIRDRQNQLVAELSKLSDVAVQQRADGAIDVTLTSGQALVIGGQAYPLSLSPNGLAQISLDGVNVTSAITSGRIGGLLQVRDTIIPGYIGRLDQLAYDLATAINTVHASGFDNTGAPAGSFFATLVGVSGAAQALAVDPSVAANSGLVAASGTGAVGDTATALQLSALRDGRVSLGGTRTVFEAWSQMAFAVGSDAASARASAASHRQVVTQLQQLRAQASGVSYDEEAANLMRYQRAYEANARYFQTVLDTLDSLMEMVR